MNEDEFIRRVKVEYRRARDKHPEMHSLHEGYAILLEEVDELWGLIKGQDPFSSAIRLECIQIASMALAICLELT